MSNNALSEEQKIESGALRRSAWLYLFMALLGLSWAFLGGAFLGFLGLFLGLFLRMIV